MALVLSEIFGESLPGGSSFQKLITTGSVNLSSNFTLSYNRSYGVDVSGGSITIDVPVTAPDVYDKIVVYDATGSMSTTNYVTLDLTNSGQRLFPSGVNEFIITIDKKHAHVELTYVGVGGGWSLSYSNKT